MRVPPASHYKYFKKECPCFLEGAPARSAVLVRLKAQGTGALMYYYRCRGCAYALSEFIPHKHIGDAHWIDLNAWCPGHSNPSILKQRFDEIHGVLAPATVVAPAPGEVPDHALVEAKLPHLHYFVDETGDPNLFARGGRSNIGTPGCTRAFMIGALYVENPREIDAALSSLHHRIIADPSLKHICSLRPEANKTALMFHAKDDHRLVRDRVFEVLRELRLNVLAVVRRKSALFEHACHTASKGGRKASWQNEYDSMIARLFKDRLHVAQQTTITIARRGSSDRTENIKCAMRKAKAKFEEKWQVVNPHAFQVQLSHPAQHYGLQAVDYLMWAASRAFERNEFEKFDQHANVFRLIIDVDDRRHKKTGEYYSAANPLTQEKIKPFEA